jgi:hypothetical protein
MPSARQLPLPGPLLLPTFIGTNPSLMSGPTEKPSD